MEHYKEHEDGSIAEEDQFGEGIQVIKKNVY